MRTIRFVIVVTFTLALVSLLVVPGYADFEGFWLQTTVTESNLPMASKESVTTQEKIFHKPGMMKVVDLNAGEMMILRLDKEVIWQVDTKESTYAEVTFAEMEEASDERKKQMAKTEVEMMKEMKDMPPEQRKHVEKMMGSKMSTLMGSEEEVELSLKRTYEKENVNGYNCEHVVVTVNNDPFIDMWITDKFDLGGALFNFYKKMNIFKYEPTKELREFKGFPIKTVHTMDMGMGTVKNVTTVTKVIATSLKETEFDVPKGFQKKEMKMMRME